MCGGSSARLREMPNNAPATQRLRFEIPSPGLADSYRGLVQEFVDRGEQLIPFILSLPNELFSEFLRQLDAWSRGEDLPAGFVPHSTFWLVRDDVEVVGVSNLRHRLTDELKIDGGNIGYGIRPSARGRGFANVLLRNTLDRARAMGLAEALLTCGKGNYASASTIVRNGGVLVSEAFIESRGEIVQRYRIDLASTANAL
jgi:predicted acetyltransferase